MKPVAKTIAKNREGKYSPTSTSGEIRRSILEGAELHHPVGQARGEGTATSNFKAMIFLHLGSCQQDPGGYGYPLETTERASVSRETFVR